jgi:N-carbamoylputrescine amidase
MKDIRAALAVTRSWVGHTDDNLDGMCQWIRAAKKKNADLICFPEMNITGYLHRDPIRDMARPVPGPISDRLAAFAAGERIVILAGLAEKSDTGHVFASHLVVQPSGEVGIYRKLHVSPVEQAVLSPGAEPTVFDAAGVTFGIQLCYDAHFPGLSTQMAVKGAEMIFMPHASPRGDAQEKLLSWMRHLPARAFDNSLFVLACNQIGDNGHGLSFPGVAVVIGPTGRILKKTVADREELLVVDLASKELDAVRTHPMRFFLPNRRPELYGDSARRKNWIQ